jgi:IPT/TIG domain
MIITGYQHLIYRQKPVSGSWSAPIDLGVGDRSNLFVDSLGRIYVVYTCENSNECNFGQSYYRVRLPNSGWQPPRAMPVADPWISAQADGTLYLVWKVANEGIYYSPWSGDSSISPQLLGKDSPLLNITQVAIDPLGAFHFFLMEGGYQGYYISCTPGQLCTTPEKLPHATGPAKLLVDQQGTLYLINSADTNDFGVYYRYKLPQAPWGQSARLSQTPYDAFGIVADSAGRAHLFVNGAYRHTRDAAVGSASIAQAITIPSSMHKPTLAFDYMLSGITPASGSQIDVTVSAGITAEQVFSATVGNDWTLATIDMQRWAGRTVSVTISLRQAGSVPTATALFDEASLGSWLTPRIQQVAPQAADNPAVATVITITGENFLTAPGVRLNTTALTNIQRVDEQTVRATVPAGLKPGLYTLWVTNPGGQTTAFPRFLIGKQVLLPLILR